MRYILRSLVSANTINDRVRRLLVDTLYTQRSSLLIGALCGIATSLVAAHQARHPQITLTAAVLITVATLRIAMAYLLPLSPRRRPQVLEPLFEAGAFSYSGAAGLIAAQTIYLHAPSSVQTLMIANAIGYGVGIAARNAGRPAIAIGQLLLALGPTIAVAGAQKELAWQTLSIGMILLIAAMMSITLNVFRVLRDSIAAAETSQRLARKMQTLARTDVVTGLLNRAGLNHRLVEHVSQLPPDQKFALFWIDLDKFKEVNDALGHHVGDHVLAEVGDRLARQAPKGATLSRFGGDEFIVACETRDRREVQDLAQRMLDEITRPIRINGDRLEIGGSMGIAILPDDGTDIDTLMQSADLALYHSKVNGRRQIHFFDPSMTRNLVRRREIETELRAALQRDELSIFFQPIIDLNTGRIRSFEALVRWFHPEKGEMLPDEFIPVAEESGAIITLGNWITSHAAKTAAKWPEDITLAVNLSPVQIKAPGAALGILNAIREARLPPSRLELEITETVLLDHSPNTESFMAELTAAGVRFALDDFGTGYSSLSYLNKYPFSKIKVDRSFVSGVNVGKKSDAIIRAVTGMASTLEMEIVAEGLETIEQVRAVREAGCTLGQGYHFSRAVPDYLAAMLLTEERDKSGTHGVAHQA